MDVLDADLDCIPCPCSRATRQVVCSAEGVKAFVQNASQKAAVLAASALIAGVSGEGRESWPHLRARVLHYWSGERCARGRLSAAVLP